MIDNQVQSSLKFSQTFSDVKVTAQKGSDEQEN
jgi:hypothetical protein